MRAVEARPAPGRPCLVMSEIVGLYVCYRPWPLPRHPGALEPGKPADDGSAAKPYTEEAPT